MKNPRLAMARRGVQLTISDLSWRTRKQNFLGSASHAQQCADAAKHEPHCCRNRNENFCTLREEKSAHVGTGAGGHPAAGVGKQTQRSVTSRWRTARRGRANHIKQKCADGASTSQITQEISPSYAPGPTSEPSKLVWTSGCNEACV